MRRAKRKTKRRRKRLQSLRFQNPMMMRRRKNRPLQSRRQRRDVKPQVGRWKRWTKSIKH
jgi:hypothetical protein